MPNKYGSIKILLNLKCLGQFKAKSAYVWIHTTQYLWTNSQNIQIYADILFYVENCSICTHKADKNL